MSSAQATGAAIDFEFADIDDNSNREQPALWYEKRRAQIVTHRESRARSVTSTQRKQV
jgi:hypothetical protein